jgi:hypothetical protein
MMNSMNIDLTAASTSSMFITAAAPFVQALHMISENIIYAAITKKPTAPTGDPSIQGTPDGVILLSLDGGYTWNREREGYQIYGFTNTPNGVLAYGGFGRFLKMIGQCTTQVGLDQWSGTAALLYPTTAY